MGLVKRAGPETWDALNLTCHHSIQKVMIKNFLDCPVDFKAQKYLKLNLISLKSINVKIASTAVCTYSEESN